MEPMDSSSDTEDDWELDEDGEGVELSPNGWAPCTAPHHITNHFASSAKFFESQVLPAHSFISGQVAFHLRFNPVIGSIKICDVVERYHLPDLRAALVHYIYRNHNDRPLQVRGQRHHRADDPLPFEQLQVWHKIQLQQKAHHDPASVLPPQTLNASPPVAGWPKGRYDTAFVNVDDSMVWPCSGLEGLTPSLTY